MALYDSRRLSCSLGPTDRLSWASPAQPLARRAQRPGVPSLVWHVSPPPNMTERGGLAYPYSTREAVAIVKHVAAFPQDGLLVRCHIRKGGCWCAALMPRASLVLALMVVGHPSCCYDT
eukprot:1346222-Prymnesium_polylepis.1